MTPAKKKPELLSPAGDWPSLRAAIDNGADSVYFGVKNINMRHHASNFDMLEIPKITRLVHKNNKKAYLTLNTLIQNKEVRKVKTILEAAKAAQIDAVIVWDMAALGIANEIGVPLHLSTQASVANILALEKYIALGVRRVILARECTLFDIKQMIKVRDKKRLVCEIETFIHGAMCVSISGRCFMSLWSFNQSANLGKCIQPCRREYYIKDSENEADYIIGQDYVMSPRDLCTLDFIDELVAAGIDSFKIEGRMRSSEYTKITTSVYRQAIDSCLEGKWNKRLLGRLKEDLGQVYNRGFSTGFYFGRPKESASRHLEHSHEKIYIGYVSRFFKKINVAELRIQTGTLKAGDHLLFIGKSTPALTVKVTELQQEHKAVEQVVKGQAVGVKLPIVVRPKDKVFLWRRKK